LEIRDKLVGAKLYDTSLVNYIVGAKRFLIFGVNKNKLRFKFLKRIKVVPRTHTSSLKLKD